MQTKNEVDLTEKRATYTHQMDRQIQEALAQISELERISDERHAAENQEVKKKLEEMRKKLDELIREFDAFRTGKEPTWPEISKDISSAYKELEELIVQVSSKVKRK